MGKHPLGARRQATWSNYPLLNQHRNDIGNMEHFQVTEFPSRTLDKQSGIVSYRETWTIPPWTVYALGLPKDFFAADLNARNDGSDVRFEIASTPTGCIFYHAIFGGADQAFVCRIEARLKHDADDTMEILRGAEVVEGQRSFDPLRSAVTRRALSADFWFKLITLGGKLFEDIHR